MENKKFLELYIHIPFCEKKCLYCDFVSFSNQSSNIENYITQLIKEIKSKVLYAKNYIISTIFIGGGTPSFINEKYISQILNTIYENYNINDNVEISIESNPHSGNFEKYKTYIDNGVNRLSIGVQSIHENELQALGRIHTFRDFLETYDAAIHAGFTNINFDIMNGIPYQTEVSFRATLKQLMKLNPKHLSIYNLIIEPYTTFFTMNQNGILNLPSETEMEKIDWTTEELCAHYNYEKYEISNYAKKGYACLHNLGYWSDIEYLGFGLNASSYLGGYRYKNFSNLNKYLSLDYERFIEDINKYLYYESAKLLLKKELMSEFIYIGLRKVTGISKLEFFQKFNENIEEVFSQPLQKFLSLNLIQTQNDRYYLSKRGMDISNQILCEFLL